MAAASATLDYPFYSMTGDCHALTTAVISRDSDPHHHPVGHLCVLGHLRPDRFSGGRLLSICQLHRAASIPPRCPTPRFAPIPKQESSVNTQSQPGVLLRSMMERMSVATLSTVDEQGVL